MNKELYTYSYNNILSKKHEVGFCYQESNRDIEEHYHDFVEIVCQLSGTSKHQVDGKSYELSYGEALFINLDQCHKNFASDGMAINIVLPTQFFQKMVYECNYDIKINQFRNDVLNKRCNTFINLNDNAKQTLSEIAAYEEEEMSAKYFIQKLNIMKLVLLVSDEIKKTSDVESDIDDDVISYIQSDIKNANLSEYAKMHNYSVSSVSQKVKAAYGISFVEILQDIRLVTSAQMLISSNANIDSIIEECGYNNKTHFYDLFKKKYGLTPFQYRKKNINLKRL